VKYEVEIATTYYDVAEVDADDAQQARARVEAGLGLLRLGSTVSFQREVRFHDSARRSVYYARVEADADRLDRCQRSWK
jgi:hypothetical protein